MGYRVKSGRTFSAGNVQLQVIGTSQIVLALFALVVATLSTFWYVDARNVATERSARIIANHVQIHIDPQHPDLNEPRLLQVMRDALKLDDSIYMIAVLDGQGVVVNAVGESAPYVRGVDLAQPVLDPLTGKSTSTVLVRASSNPFEMALIQPIMGMLLTLAATWAFFAYLMYRLLRAVLNETLVASGELASQCAPLLRIKGSHPHKNDLPQILTSARESLLHAEQRTRVEVAARTSALRDAYDLSLQAARSDANHVRNLDEAVEKERRRIALEIHDTLNAQTVALRLYASAIKTRAASFGDAQTIDLAEKVDKEMSALFDTARSIVRGLRPELLESVGLAGALTQLASKLNVETKSCQLKIGPKLCETLSNEQAFAIFRVAQEATTNAQKHANATEIAIELFAASPPWHCRLVVSDNGHGFDVAHSTESTTGLEGMKTRTSAIGGVLSITSNATGTVVTMLV